MAWRLAKSLETLRAQVNAWWPNRSKISDGTIGDTAHRKRRSDHNPNSKNVVRAWDITEDFKNGPDLTKLLPLLLKDKRVKYCIYETKLYKPGGIVQKSKGHTKHLHISVSADEKLYDDKSPWHIEALTATKGPSVVQSKPEPPKPAVAPPVAVSEPILEQKGNKTVPEQAIKTFMGLGWSKVAACALVASLMWESAGNAKWTINPKAHGDKDKHGRYKSHGAGQWQGTRYHDLLGYAQRHNVSSGELDTQLGFVDWELKNTERRAGILLHAAITLEEAMAAAVAYWRPSVPHTDKRLAIARKLMDGQT
jgi:hypothetical protein